MDHINILKKSWQVLRGYRTIWFFGIIQAFLSAFLLTTSSAIQLPINLWQFGRFPGLFESVLPPNLAGFLRDLAFHIDPFSSGTFFGFMIFFELFLLVFGFSYQILHFIAEVAMVKMVDRFDQTGEKVQFLQGLRLGWNRSVWRIILIALAISIITVILLVVPVVALIFIFVPFFTPGTNLDIVLIVMPFIILIGSILLIVVSLLIAVFMMSVVPIIIRSCILDDLGVFDSIKRGFGLFRSHLKDIGVMALLNYTLIMGWGILLVFLRMFLSLIGILAAGAAVWLIGGAVGAFSVDAAPNALVIPLLVGGLIYFIITTIPLTLAYAVLFVFQSSLWTLTYRQLPPLEKSQPETEAVLPET